MPGQPAKSMSAYFITGSDNREYGPASAEAVRQWIREHRADANSKVRIQGDAGYTRLGEQAEFAEDLKAADALEARLGYAGPGAAAPSAANGAVAGAGERLAAEVLARGYDLQIGDCFARGWELLVGRFRLLVGATVLVYLLFFGISSIPGIGVGAVIVLGFVLLGGLNLVFLKELRGEPANVGVVFAGFNAAFLPLLLAGTVATILVVAGGFLCLAPGIYLLVAWHLFTPLLILDKGLDFWQALECSRRVVTRHWWTCGGLFLLAVLAVAAGLLACLVGVLVTLPLATAAVVVAYEDVFGARPEARSGGMLPPPETPVDEPDLEAQVHAPEAEPGERGAVQLSPSDERMPEPGQGSEPGAAIAPKEIPPSELTGPKRRPRAASKSAKPKAGIGKGVAARFRKKG